MRILIACLIFFALLPGFLSSVRADEPDALLSISEAQPYRERWQECAASAVERELEGKRSVKAIVEGALKSCRPQESALTELLRRRIGIRSAARIISGL